MASGSIATFVSGGTAGHREGQWFPNNQFLRQVCFTSTNMMLINTLVGRVGVTSSLLFSHVDDDVHLGVLIIGKPEPLIERWSPNRKYIHRI